MAVGATHKLFFCPSRRRPQTVTFRDPEYFGGAQLTHALCDYAASNLEETGVVRPQDPIRIADILDGTSQTLMVSEKRLNVALLGQEQADDRIGYTAGWDLETVRRTDKEPEADFHSTTPDENGAFENGGKRFGSSHSGKFNAVFADGSVRSISYDIDETIFSYLGDINDGNVISANAY